MSNLNTITFINTGAPEGAAKLIQLEIKPGTLPSIGLSGILQDNSDRLYTGKIIINSALCLKESRYIENLETTANIQNGTANYIGFKSPDLLSSNQIYILPLDGTSGQHLTTDGSGVLSWNTDLGGDVNSALDFLNDNRLIRTDFISGVKNIQQSGIVIDDTDQMAGIQNINILVDPLFNTSYGFECLINVTDDSNNTGFGHQVMKFANNSSDSNCGFGKFVLGSITNNANKNCGYGQNSLALLVSGDENTCYGDSSGLAYTGIESNNICIANDGIIGDSSVMRLGSIQNTCFIAGISGVSPSGTTNIVIFDPLTDQMGESQVLLDSSGNMTNITHLQIDHSATNNDDHAVEIDVFSDVFGDVKALLIEYRTGAISSVEDEEAILINIDETLSLGGRVVALEVIGTDQGLAEIDAIECGVGCHPIRQQTGTFIDADLILNIAADVTTALSQGGGGNINIFSNDNESVTISDAAKFSEIEFILDIVASGAGIAALFEYSTGASPTVWNTFSPADGTNQMKSSGVIIWDLVDIPLWVIATSGNFEIKITRTRNSLPTTPRCDLLQISSTTIFSWDKNGDLIVNDVHTSDFQGTGEIDFNTCDTFNLVATSSGVTSVKIFATGNSSSKISIENTLGTTADSIKISSSLGGVEIAALTAGIELNSTATSTKLGFFGSPISQITTGVAEGSFTENAGGSVVNVDSTVDGYTFQQVVKALRNYGLLA